MKLSKPKRWEDPVLISLSERASASGGSEFDCGGGTGASEYCTPHGTNATKGCSRGTGGD